MGLGRAAPKPANMSLNTGITFKRRTAVITRKNKQFVFIANDSKAHVRLVETGILEGWKIEISKGLKKGDRVIVVGHRDIDEGQEINIVRSISDPEDLFK